MIYENSCDRLRHPSLCFELSIQSQYHINLHLPHDTFSVTLSDSSQGLKMPLVFL